MTDLYLYPNTTSNPRPIPHVWGSIANFHKASESKWLENGFIKYVNEPPAYDSETEVLVRTGIIDGVQQYEVKPKPEPTPPEAVTPLRFYTALYMTNGLTEDNIRETLEGIEDESERTLALTAFNRALSIRRDNQLVQSLKSQMNATEEDLDQLFLLAESLDV